VCRIAPTSHVLEVIAAIELEDRDMVPEPEGTPAEIRAPMADWARAVRSKDVDAAMRHYATDVVAFELAPPLQYTGAEALRTSLSAWFATFRGPIGCEVRDLVVTAATRWPSVAASTGSAGPGRTAGRRTSGCARPWACAGATACGRSRTSTPPVPFYMDGSYRARGGPEAVIRDCSKTTFSGSAWHGNEPLDSSACGV
jgi:ketosteroid isomerase-like protein